MQPLHADWTLADVTAGRAQVVNCPDCGQLEIWSVDELNDHGRCRAAAHADPCPACDPDGHRRYWHSRATDRMAADPELRAYSDFALTGDWADDPAHLQWLCSAPAEEIAAWAIACQA